LTKQLPIFLVELHEYELSTLITFSLEEMFLVLTQIELLKYPSLDGMPLVFFNKYWHIVVEGATDYVLDFLSREGIYPLMHATNVIILKVKNSDVLPLSTY
jgi:hypothetical protein